MHLGQSREQNGATIYAYVYKYIYMSIIARNYHVIILYKRFVKFHLGVVIVMSLFQILG